MRRGLLAAGKIEKILWLLFGAQILLVICRLVGLVGGGAYDALLTYLPLALLILHAWWTLGWRRALTFMLLGAGVGFAAETISLHYGTVFGGDYTYRATASLWSVPYAVIVFWAVFIYIGYWLVTSFVHWLGGELPRARRGSLVQVGLLVLADGLAVTAIDLLMDPISVRQGSWSWVDGGPYFGVPIGNFVGWFCVTALVTGSFRVFEYYRPRPFFGLRVTMFVLPVLGYLLIGLHFLAAALSYKMFALASIGMGVVILPVVLNLVLCVHNKRKTTLEKHA